jgi:hypothetical protein
VKNCNSALFPCFVSYQCAVSKTTLNGRALLAGIALFLADQEAIQKHLGAVHVHQCFEGLKATIDLEGKYDIKWSHMSPLAKTSLIDTIQTLCVITADKAISHDLIESIVALCGSTWSLIYKGLNSNTQKYLQTHLNGDRFLVSGIMEEPVSDEQADRAREEAETSEIAMLLKNVKTVLDGKGVCTEKAIEQVQEKKLLACVQEAGKDHHKQNKQDSGASNVQQQRQQQQREHKKQQDPPKRDDKDKDEDEEPLPKRQKATPPPTDKNNDVTTACTANEQNKPTQHPKDDFKAMGPRKSRTLASFQSRFFKKKIK